MKTQIIEHSKPGLYCTTLKKGNWKISIVSPSSFAENGISYTIIVYGKYACDYPIKYKTGGIAYDNPYILPKYIKVEVSNMFNLRDKIYALEGIKI